jgi:hypothetical protein
MLRKFIDRLWPHRVRQVPELLPEQRLQYWSTVADNDYCLRCVMDLLGDVLEGNMAVAFDPNRPHRERIEAVNRAGIAKSLMEQMEQERATAQEIQKKRQPE